MGRFSEPPFVRGETYFNGDFIDTTDLNNIGGEILEGRDYDFDDVIHGTGCTVTCRVVRNMNAVAVTATQLLKPTVAGTGASGALANAEYAGRVSGVTDAAAIKCYVADELLPANGVPQYDLFYVVVEGPTLVTTPAAGVAVSIGGGVVSSTTGRGTAQDMSGATSALAGNIQNRVGIAMRACTAGQTSFPLLTYVHRW